MKRDVNDLKKLTLELMKTGNAAKVKEEQSSLINKIYAGENEAEEQLASIIDEENNGIQTDVEVFSIPENASESRKDKYEYAEEIEEEENLSLHQKELELIKKSLEKYNGKRKDAADELGISERTLYRKIKQYDL
jgi:transcriptional regulator with PAS, ATPase and Fis domain